MLDFVFESVRRLTGSNIVANEGSGDAGGSVQRPSDSSYSVENTEDDRHAENSQGGDDGGQDGADFPPETTTAMNAGNEPQTDDGGESDENETTNSSGQPDNFMESDSSDEDGDDEEGNEEERNDEQSNGEEGSQEPDDDAEDEGEQEEADDADDTSRYGDEPAAPFFLTGDGEDLLAHGYNRRAATYYPGTKGLQKAKYWHGNNQHGYMKMKRRYHVRQKSGLGDITSLIYDEQGNFIEERNESQGPRRAFPLRVADVETPVIRRPSRDQPHASPASPGPSRPSSPVAEEPVSNFGGGAGSSDVVGLGIDVSSDTSPVGAEPETPKLAPNYVSKINWDEEYDEVEAIWAPIEASRRAGETSTPDLNTASHQVGQGDTTAQQTIPVDGNPGPVIVRTPAEYTVDAHEGLQSGGSSDIADSTDQPGAQDEVTNRLETNVDQASVVLPSGSESRNIAALEPHFSIDSVSHITWQRGSSSADITPQQALARQRDSLIETMFAQSGQYLYPGISRDKYAQIMWYNKKYLYDASLFHQQLGELNARYQKLKREYQEYQQSSMSVTDEFREKIKNLTADNDRTDAELVEKTQKHRDCMERGQRLKEEIASLNEKIANLTDELAKAKAIISGMFQPDAELVEMTSKYHAASQQHLDCMEREKQLEETVASLSDEVERLKKLTSEKNEPDSELVETTRKYNAASEQHLECMKRERQLKEEVARLTKELASRIPFVQAVEKSRKSSTRTNTQWPNPQRLAEVAAEFLNNLSENEVKCQPHELEHELRKNPRFEAFVRFLLQRGMRFKSERLAQALRDCDVFDRNSSSEASRDLDTTAWSPFPYESVTTANLRRELHELRQTIEDLERERNELLDNAAVEKVHQFEEVRAYEQEHEDKITKLEAELEEAQGTTAAVLQVQDQQNQEIEGLRAKLSETQNTPNPPQVVAKNDVQRKMAERVQVELDSTRETLKQLIEQMDTQDCNVGNSRKVGDDDDLSAKHEESKKQNLPIQDNVNNLKDQITKLEQQLKQCHETKIDLKTSVAALTSTNSECEGRCNKVSAEMADLKKSHEDELTNQKASSEAKIKSLMKEIDDLKRTIRGLSAANDQIAKGKTGGNPAQQEIGSATDAPKVLQISHSHSEFTELKHDIAESRKCEQDLKTKCGELERRVAVLEQAVMIGAKYAIANDNLEAELKTCKRHGTELREQVETLQNEVQDHESKRSSEVRETEKLEKETDASANRIRQLEAANQKLQKALDSTKSELTSAQQANKALTDHRDYALKKVKRMKQELNTKPIFSTFDYEKSNQGPAFDHGKSKQSLGDLFDIEELRKEHDAFNAWYDEDEKERHKRWFDLCGYVPNKEPVEPSEASASEHENIGEMTDRGRDTWELIQDDSEYEPVW